MRFTVFRTVACVLHDSGWDPVDAHLARGAHDGPFRVHSVRYERYVNDLHRIVLLSVTSEVHVLGSNYFLTSLLPDSYRACVLTTFCSSIHQSKYTQLALTGGDVRATLSLPFT